jgi:hypothetical protein
VLHEDQKWASVSLRLWGDELPVDQVEKRLDLPARRIGRKGEPVGRNPRSKKYSGNLWSWWVSADSRSPLEAQLEMALELLEKRRTALQQLIQETKCRAELFLGFSSGNGQGGSTFSPSLLRRLADLGLPILFDLYPPDVDEKEMSSGDAP